MNSQQIEQLDQQRKTWNQYSRGWRKWDEILMTTMRPVSDSLIDSLQLSGNEHVLDVASGTGEPGLTLSALLLQGRVTGTDLSENMVDIANEHAEQRSISNYQSQVSDASDMPFKDDTFDHIICRYGIMFFPDVETGLREMARVLKPGGKLTVAVWAGPELNPFITILAMTVIEKLNLPKPAPDVPGIFRCAKPGLVSQHVKNIGLENVTEWNVKGEAKFGSPEQYWEIFSDVAGPVMEALNSQPQDVRADVKAAVINKAKNFVREGEMHVNWDAIIVSGIKGN